MIPTCKKYYLQFDNNKWTTNIYEGSSTFMNMRAAGTEPIKSSFFHIETVAPRVAKRQYKSQSC